MARVELPESRLKARKRRRRTRILLAFGLLVFLLCAAMVGVSHIPALLIKKVTVSGAQTLSSSTIRAYVEERLAGNYAFVLPKHNIFLYPRNDIARSLMRDYPVLSSADVHAADFHTVGVVVVEREPRALWCDSGCYFMDENGIVYGEAPVFSEPVYLSYYGGAAGERLPKQYLSANEFQSLSALVDALAHELEGEQALSVSVDTERDVRIRFASGFELLFALDDAPGDIYERFSLALKSDPLTTHPLADFMYVDLRFGDKLYYKLKQ